MTPVPLDFMGAHEGSIGFRKTELVKGAHRNDIEKLACEAVKTFFFFFVWRSLNF